MTRDQLNDTTTSVLFFAVKLFDLGSVEIVWKEVKEAALYKSTSKVLQYSQCKRNQNIK